MGNRDEQKVFNIHAERDTTDPSHLLSNIFHFWLDDRLDDDDKRKIMMCLKVIHQFDTLMCKSAFCCNLLLKILSNHTLWVLMRSRIYLEFRILFHRWIGPKLQYARKGTPSGVQTFPISHQVFGVESERVRAPPNYLLRPCVRMFVCCSQAEFSKLT